MNSTFNDFERKQIFLEYEDQNDRRKKPAYIEISPVNINGYPSKRIMIVLRTHGCVYGKKTTCTMCGFKLHSDASVTYSDLVSQIDYSISIIKSFSKEIEQVDLLTLGSFYDNDEIVPKFREYILLKISDLNFIKKLVVESRASHITDEKLLETKRILGNKYIEVGIGVESSNEVIRNKIIGKGLQQRDLIKAIRLISNQDMSFQPYLLIKPPGLSEREAIEDAVKSVEDMVDLARNNKVKLRIALEPVFVPPETKIENLYLNGQYKLLNIWSIIEVIKRVHGLATIFVGMSDENLSMNRIPSSCEKCSEHLRNAINQYNALQSLSVLDFKCSCREIWAKEVGFDL